MLIIDARPQTKTKDDCPIDRYDISGNAPGIKIVGNKGLVEVDKDKMTDKVLLKNCRLHWQPSSYASRYCSFAEERPTQPQLLCHS